MQLSISNKPSAKVRTSDGKPLKTHHKNIKVSYLSSLALKSTYTEGFIVNDNVSIAQLLTHGFSCWEYTNKTRAEILNSKRKNSVNYIDKVNGYRETDKAISLLRTHWLDYDQGVITIDEMTKRWKENLPNIGAIIIPSSSGNGIRILYDSTNITENIPFGVQILNEELAYISKHLDVQFDESKTTPSSHSGHLELQGTYSIGDKTYSPEHPVYEPFIIIDGESLNIPIEFDHTLTAQPVANLARIESYDTEAFTKELTYTPAPFDKNRSFYTLPASFTYDTDNGHISTEELYLRIVREGQGKVGTASPVGAENSRLESTYWGYDSVRGILQGKEIGHGKGDHEKQEGNRKYSVAYAPTVTVVAPKGAKEVADNYYLLGTTLYRVVSIGTSASNIIEDYAHVMNLDLFKDVFNYIGQTDKGYILLPNNPYLNIDGAYTAKELLTHLDNVNTHLVADDIVRPTKPTLAESKRTIGAIDTFLKANALTIKQLNIVYGADELYTEVDRETGILTIYRQYHSLIEPKLPRPSDADIEWYYGFAREHQFIDIKALATAVVAKSRNALPKGVRIAAYYQNGPSGLGKSVYDDAFVDLGLSPKDELTEYMEDGGKGKAISDYSQYLINAIDEADRFSKRLPTFVRQATSKGITGRIIYGMSESAVINFIMMSTHTGIKSYDADNIDEQDIDRIMFHHSKDSRKFAELDAHEVPYEVAKLRAMLYWAIYDAFSHALTTIERDKPVDFDFTPFQYSTNTNLTAVALHILAGGLDKFSKQNSVLKGKVYYPKIDGLEQVVTPYSKCRNTMGERLYTDGIYWANASMYLDTLDVAFDYVENTGANKMVKNLLNTNKRELKKLLGIPLSKRTELRVNGEKAGCYKITDFPFTEAQLDRLWDRQSNKLCHPALNDKTLEEIEVMYSRGAKLENPNREQMAELVMAYYSKIDNDEEEVMVTQSEETKEVDLW